MVSYNDDVKRAVGDGTHWKGDMSSSLIDWMSGFTTVGQFNDMFAATAAANGLSKEELAKNLATYIDTL